MLFIVGVGMMILGVALCLMGDMQLPKGWFLKAVPARIAGGILLSFFPMVIIGHFFMDSLHWLIRQAILWFLALMCLGTSAVIVWWTSAPEKISNASADMQPPVELSATDESATPAEALLADQPAEGFLVDDLENDPLIQHSRRQKKNPFDFS